MYNSTLNRNKAIAKSKKVMLRKLKNGEPKRLGEIDEFGSEDSQAFAELVNENKIEVVNKSTPIIISDETYQISGLFVQLKKEKTNV